MANPLFDGFEPCHARSLRTDEPSMPAVAAHAHARVQRPSASSPTRAGSDENRSAGTRANGSTIACSTFAPSHTACMMSNLGSAEDA